MLTFQLTEDDHIGFTVSYNRWYRVTVVYDYPSGKAQLYDGIRARASKTLPRYTGLNTAGDVTVGSDGDAHFTGRVACLQVYPVALSAAKIIAIQDCPLDDGKVLPT